MKHARKDYKDLRALEARIPKDEPVFILRAQDVAAPVALRAWAIENSRLGGDTAMSELIYDFAKEFEAWRPRKIADIPPLCSQCSGRLESYPSGPELYCLSCNSEEVSA